MDAPTARFALAVLARDDDGAVRAVPLDELDGAPGSPPAAVDTGSATLVLETGGHDWMPLPWVLGDLASLARQFDAAAARLRDGGPAIVRSAVDDRSDVTSLLFEPAGDEVTISSFQAPATVRYLYPTSPARGEELYAAVLTGRDRLLREHAVSPWAIVDARVPRDTLLAALTRDADLARRLVERAGVEPG